MDRPTYGYVDNGGNARMTATLIRACQVGVAAALALLLAVAAPASANPRPQFEFLTVGNVTRILQQAIIAARSSGTLANIITGDYLC